MDSWQYFSLQNKPNTRLHISVSSNQLSLFPSERSCPVRLFKKYIIPTFFLLFSFTATPVFSANIGYWYVDPSGPDFFPNYFASWQAARDSAVAFSESQPDPEFIEYYFCAQASLILAYCEGKTYRIRGGERVLWYGYKKTEFRLNQDGTCLGDKDPTGACIFPPELIAQPEKTGGESCPLMTKHPISLARGNKFRRETDIAPLGATGLSFTRYYNSLVFYNTAIYGNKAFGEHWSHTYNRYVNLMAFGAAAFVYRPDGKTYTFTNNGASWVTDADIHDTLVRLFETDGTTPAGWQYTTEDDTIETYGADGKLQLITDIKGNTHSLSYNTTSGLLDTATTTTGESLSFTYDASNRINDIIDHMGRVWQYAYDTNNNLQYVSEPDGTSATGSNPFGKDNPYRTYHYEKSDIVNVLTGITDERGIRYANFEYNVQNRATASYLGPTDLTPLTTNDRIEGVTIAYNDTTGARTLTDSNNTVTTYNTQVLWGTALPVDITGPGCTTCGSSNTSYQYDANNNTLAKTKNGITTRYGNYNAKGNYQCKVEGITAVDTTDFVLTPCGFDPIASPNARRTDYTYDPRFHRKVLTQTESSVFSGSNKITTYTYDAFGNRISVAVTGFTPGGTAINRSTTMAYTGPLNQISLIDGPRLDVNDHTTFDYYLNDIGQGNNRARLKSVTDANSVFVRNNIQYTSTGKVLSEDRPNGLSLSYGYYPGNDRLQTLTETADASSHITHWSYLATGEVQSITQGYGSPAASTLSFGYDAARRLTRITDGLGNYIQYTLDTEGNREAEQTFDALGTPLNEADDVMTKTMAQTFDVYNRLEKLYMGVSAPDDLNALEIQDPHYQPDGTLGTTIDGNLATTAYGYDDLKRLLTSTHDFGTNADNTDDLLTQYGYDAADRLISVTDPNGNTTAYVYDDLGNLISQTSPDTGTTSFSYDAAGNLKTKTEDSGATNRITNYSYDALNRLTTIDVAGTEHDITYTYDSCANGVGRLCLIQTGSVLTGTITTSYAYDGFGQVTGHQGLSVGYDEAGRLKTLTYPSGAIVTYGFNAAGQINLVDLTLNGLTQTLASGITYQPFGPLKGLSYGNGHVLTYTHDMAYRIGGISIPGILALNYGQYDGNGNIQQRTDSLTALTESFVYDAINRLDLANGLFGSRNYDYDKNGNRTQVNEDSVIIPYLYEANTNRLNLLGAADVLLDVFGNTLQKGSWTYSYTPHNRLATTTENTTLMGTYAYNGLGQRIQKSDVTTTTRFGYGINGKLLTESDQNGNVRKEYVYLNGTLLSVLDHSADQDGDGVPDTSDNCILSPNPLQADADADGYGNRCDADFNNDGTVNAADVSGFLNAFITQNLIGDLNENGYVNAADISVLISLFFKPPGPSGEHGQADSSRVYYVHNDHLGTPQTATDETGIIAWKANYDPFGRATVNPTSTIELNARFPGQYYDGETSLHYNYYRTYDPETGRYLTSDPIGLGGGLNMYGYVANNPLRFIDPLGLAYFANRPLEGLYGNPSRSPLADWLNIELSHEQLFFEDSKGGDIGFFSDGKVRPDDPKNLSKYWDRRNGGYNDSLMRDAVKNVGDPGKYCLIGSGKNNCQDWADKVRDEYEKLKKKRDQCKKTE